MAAATGRVDEMVKDYLLYRGFTSAHRAFEGELKNEKERALRVITNVFVRPKWTHLNYKFCLFMLKQLSLFH